MPFDIKLPLRGFQFLFAIISLGLNGYVANYFDGAFFFGVSISEVNFLIFCSVWTMVITIYLIVAGLRFPSFAPLIAVLVIDALTMLFWFAGFIALAVLKGKIGSCSGTLCNDITAAIVFGAFEWLLFVVTTVIAALAFFRSGSSKAAPAAAGTAA